MKEKLIKELEKELGHLDAWIKRTEGGGWSTHNLHDMKKRRDEIKATLYDAKK